MTHFLRGILTIICVTASLQGLAQNQVYAKKIALVSYNDNVNSPLNQRERQQLEEVYADQLQRMVLSKPQRLKDIKDILRNRVKISLASENPKSQFAPLLSTVPVFNAYNKAVNRDAVFDRSNFNPLKYQFNFHGFGTSMYRVDHTDYIVTIMPIRR